MPRRPKRTVYWMFCGRKLYDFNIHYTLLHTLTIMLHIFFEQLNQNYLVKYIHLLDHASVFHRRRYHIAPTYTWPEYTSFDIGFLQKICATVDDVICPKLRLKFVLRFSSSHSFWKGGWFNIYQKLIKFDKNGTLE